MSNEGHSAENPSTKVVELQLTQSQYKFLQRLLPKQITLELKTQKRETTPKPVKKLMNNEGIAKQRSINSDVESVDSVSRRGGLREQRKVKTSHLEHRYADFEASTTTTKGVKPNNEGIKKCLNLLQKLKKHQSSYPFLEPVDVVALGLTDYYEKIPEPMDISTVETKLKNGDYSSVHDFAIDVRKIWNNAFKYNPKGHIVNNLASQMSSYFERLFKEIEDVNFNPTIYNLQKKVEKMTRKINEFNGVPSRPAYSAKPFKGSDVPMPINEIKILGQKIRALPPDGLRGVWDIVSQNPSNQNSQDAGCVEFDLNQLAPNILRELDRYVNNKLAALSKSMKKKGKELILNFDIPQTAESSYDAYQTAPDQHESTTQLSAFNSKVDTAPSNHNDDAESMSSDSSFLSE